MTQEDGKKEKKGATSSTHGSPSTIGTSKTSEENSEEYDDWDENIHTFTLGRSTGHRFRTISDTVKNPVPVQEDSASKYNPRSKRKTRSQSFSEQPRRQSLHGTAKDHAMVSKRNSLGSGSSMNSSTPSLTNGKHDMDIYKAVNDYYERHMNNEKNYDSLYGAPDYILKKPSMATSYNKPAATNPPVTTREFHRSVYWLVHNRRKYGFRHVCMLILLLIYTLLGAALFFNIETNYEHQVVDERKAVLDKRIATIAEQLILLQNGTELLVNNQMAEDFVKSTYISLLKDESLYAGSTYAKTSGDSNFKWTFASAIFFSMNIYTTTGYGSIACESMLGRICVMWYSLITIPITLVVIRDLGQCVLVYLTKLYAHILVKFRRAMGYLEPHEDSMISLPIKFCLLLLAGYLFFSAVFIYFFDEWMGYISHTGMSFFTAFYFSYISISTIGLGDIMPNNATFHPIISALFFFGMPVMKVVNRATYVFIENGVFGAFTLLESSIDRLTTKIQPQSREEETSTQPSRKVSRCSYCSHLNINESEEENQATDLLNGLTIRSLAAFARANSDVYGGGFGRVNLRAGDLVHSKTSVSQNPGTPA